MQIPTVEAPLIVTARLDEQSFLQLNALRRRHFPIGRNVVPAHVSLFHHLPGCHVAEIVQTVDDVCGRCRAFDLPASGVMFLGRGVAFRYEDDELGRIRSDLAALWAPWLTPQDRQPFRAHVTIQNKADPSVARALFGSLSIDDAPACRVEGLSIWHYLGGPWKVCAEVPFAGRRQ